MSNTKLEQYRSANDEIPARMLRWHLYGAGLENMGKQGEPEEVSVPSYGPDELLVRQDACGLCFSDTKVIALGANHPRMTGRNLAKDPVTLGHEVSCTVVGVGEYQGKPAVPDVKAGDILVSVDKVPAKGSTMGQIWSLLGGSPGDTRELVLERDGKPVTVQARVRRFLPNPPAAAKKPAAGKKPAKQ